MTKTVFYILTFLLIVISQQASAQYVAESYSTMKDTSGCDVMPQFRGGEMGLRKYIANNVRYPKIAKKKEHSRHCVHWFCCKRIWRRMQC